MIDFDFHTHTYPQSDCASQSVEELVQKARLYGVKVLALCNHGTIDGLAEAKAECEKYGIEFVNGVEFTCDIKGESADLDGTILHILGYGIDNDVATFRSYTEPVKRGNELRTKNVCGFLRSLGYDVEDCTDLKLLWSQLVEKNGFPDVKSAKNFIYSDRIESLYPIHRLTHNEAIELIHKLNGIAVWAHPTRVWQHERFSLTELPEVIDRLRAHGLDGVEAFHPDNLKTEGAVETLLCAAESRGLTVTLGSDTHHLQGEGEYFPLRKELNRFSFDFQQIKYFWKRKE